MNMNMNMNMNKGWKSHESIKNELTDEDTWLKGFFASQHDNWDGKFRTRNFHELRCRDLTLFELGNVDGKKVLDVGCGSGEYMLTVAKMGARVFGQDLGGVQVDTANHRLKKHQVNGKAFIGDAQNLSFENNYFDIVYSTDFFEHITLETKQKVIAEIYRVLKPGGRLVIKTPNLQYLKLIINIKRFVNILRFRFRFVYIAHTNNNPDNEHHGLTTYKELTDILESNFFHTPKIIPVPLIRDLIPKFVARLLYGKKIFTEEIIIVTRKSIFVGMYP